MGTCQSSTSALYALPMSRNTSKVRSSQKFPKTRKSQKLKLEIRKYDTTNPTVFSPSGTRETIPATPSSLLPSPTLYARTASSIESAATDQQNEQQPESNNTVLASESIPRSSNEIEVQIDTINVDHETLSSSAVPSEVVDQFQKLKLQAQLADRSKQIRKRKEKVASRDVMINEYRHLWKEYEQIQDQVNNQNGGEAIPKSISFFKDSDAWYVDFHKVQNQQQSLGSGTNLSSPAAANLSLLSQSTIEAQKKFFQKKFCERKKRKKRKGPLEPRIAKDKSVYSNSLRQSSLQERGHGSEGVHMNGTPLCRGTNDYNVLHRIRSSPSTEHAESYLDQTLSQTAATSEPAVPTSIVLDQNVPRKRNHDLIRYLDFASNDNASRAGGYTSLVGKQATDFSHPISKKSKERFLMMRSSKSSPTDESSSLHDAAHSAKRYHHKVPSRHNALSANPIWNMSKDHFMMMSSPKSTLLDADKGEGHSSEREKDEEDVGRSRPTPKKASNQLKPTIDYMSKADFLRMSALPDPVPMSALPDHVPATVGDPTFDDSQVMSKISCGDTFMSPSGNQERIEEADKFAEVSTSSEDDDEEDYYAWDGHMDDEEFWDMDIRRQSLGDIDELASQVSSRITTLLSKFREDNNSIQARSVNL